MSDTSSQFDAVVSKCTEIFKKKTIDYGTAWRILRSSSLTDQIFIKANRIRTIQESKQALVDEGIEPEFIGIINLSEAFPLPLPPTVIAVPPEAFAEDDARRKLLSSTLMA